MEVRRAVEPVKNVSVGTIGYVKVKPSVATIIPEEITAIIEFRSISRKESQLVKSILKKLHDISLKYKVQCEAMV